jgi:hypothetical protein
MLEAAALWYLQIIMSHAKRLSLPPALHWQRPCLTRVVPSRAYELIVDVLGHDSNGVVQRLQAATALSTQVRRQASGAQSAEHNRCVAILGRPGDRLRLRGWSRSRRVILLRRNFLDTRQTGDVSQRGRSAGSVPC